MSFSSVVKIIVPLFAALLLTSIPRKLGMYKYLLSLDDGLVGLLPCGLISEEYWDYTLGEFYGDGTGSDEASIKEYRNRLWGQTALVTGANSGTGYEVSLGLARMGVSVTMTCRNPKKCEAAAAKIREDEIVLKRGKEDRGLDDPGSAVVTMTVDTSSLKSVKSFCEEFLKAGTSDDGEGNTSIVPLDMLFLNAGIGYAPPTDEGLLKLSEDGIENMFATNVVGHHLMYKLLEPMILGSATTARTTPPRIVQTSSGASYGTKFPFLVATDLETLNAIQPLDHSLYAQSKLAQILWTKELTYLLDTEGNSSAEDPNSIVYANAGHPGAVSTNIWTTIDFTKTGGALIKGLIDFLFDHMFTPEEGALTLLYLGTAVDELQKDKSRGQYYHPQAMLMKDHKFAKDNDKESKELQEKLWKFLDELVADFV